MDRIRDRVRRVHAQAARPGFGIGAPKERNAVERCTGRPELWRGPVARTDELAVAHRAALHLAAVLLRLRTPPEAGLRRGSRR
ncbi:hypothetical protein ADK60_07255 [Streptomyces sp. XY431]|nr:hypothetical protein ADK60_07255 [Streptomyces sp. XY431]